MFKKKAFFVVFEGIEKVKNDILEDEETRPVLSYGKSKDYNEKQLKTSGKNYSHRKR